MFLVHIHKESKMADFNSHILGVEYGCFWFTYIRSRFFFSGSHILGVENGFFW